MCNVCNSPSKMTVEPPDALPPSRSLARPGGLERLTGKDAAALASAHAGADVAAAVPHTGADAAPAAAHAGADVAQASRQAGADAAGAGAFAAATTASAPRLARHAAPQAFSAGPLAAAPAEPGGSRRRRLWELPAHCHCPVLGVCLPLELLRKRVGKVFDVRVTMDDYTLHVRCVHECKRRTPVSEALQRELDLRSATALRRFAAAKSADAVLALWQ
ncbi:MAG: hypothetical protein H0U56_06170, partial [Methylibium sp.]|nr:hypothetical protein [Methylibium sp.]